MDLKHILINAWSEKRYQINENDEKTAENKLLPNVYCLKCRQGISEDVEVCPVCDYNFVKNRYEHEDRSYFNNPEFLKIPKPQLEFINLEAEKSSSDDQYKYNHEKLNINEVAGEYFKKLGYSIIYSGDKYWWSIFGLLFWDIIFMKTDTCTPVEMNDENFEIHYNILKSHMTIDMPRDFFKPIFYPIREKAITKRMKELMNSDIILEIENSYYEHYSQKCRPIENWDAFSLDELRVSLELLNKEQVLLIMDILLHDFTIYRYGFPDLIVFNENELFFVETKSEENILNENQIIWIDFLVNTAKIPSKIFTLNKNNDQQIILKKQFDEIPKKNSIFKLSFDLNTYFIKDMDKLTDEDLENKQKDNERLAIELGRIGKINKATKLFEANVKTKCTLYKTYMGLSIIYARQHRLDDSIRICELGKKYCESSKKKNFDLRIDLMKNNKKYRDDLSKYRI